MPRSWKSHGISGILKFSGISGKVMEFCLKLMKVMEKSWNFEIMTKSHGKVVEFDKRVLHVYKPRPLRGRKFKQPVLCSFCMVMEFCDRPMVMEKSGKSHGILSQKVDGNPGYVCLIFI